MEEVPHSEALATQNGLCAVSKGMFQKCRPAIEPGNKCLLRVATLTSYAVNNSDAIANPTWYRSSLGQRLHARMEVPCARILCSAVLDDAKVAVVNHSGALGRRTNIVGRAIPQFWEGIEED